jgi:hypothetical protein
MRDGRRVNERPICKSKNIYTMEDYVAVISLSFFCDWMRGNYSTLPSGSKTAISYGQTII